MISRIESTAGATTFQGPDAVRLFQLIAVKAALRLEALGMRHSRGKSMRAMWAKEYGLKPRAPVAQVVAKIEEEIAVLNGKIERPAVGRWYVVRDSEGVWLTDRTEAGDRVLFESAEKFEAELALCRFINQ